jgi:hypothetical protein
MCKVAKTSLSLITFTKRLSGDYNILVPCTLTLRGYTLNVYQAPDLQSHVKVTQVSIKKQVTLNPGQLLS